jgi:hypothetical protein
MDIQLDYWPIPCLKLHSLFLAAMCNQTHIDIMTVDRIALGQSIEKGFLTDLTDNTNNWGRQKEWYEEQ